MSRFNSETRDGVCVTRCPAHIDGQAVEELKGLIAAWLSSPARLHVFDFTGVLSVQVAAFRPMVLFYQGLKKAGSFVATVHVNKEIATQIHTAGLDNVFSIKATMNEALLVAGIQVARSTIDVNFINPFIQATRLTLEIQANTKIKVGKPHLKKEAKSEVFDIAGVISLSSAAFRGSIALCFPARVFLMIYSNLLGEKYETITPETEDAVGELLNIIFGQAKTELNRIEGYQIEKAIPAIIRGNDLKVHHISRNSAIVLPFETEVGAFWLEIGMDWS